MTEIKFRNLGIWDILKKYEIWEEFSKKIDGEVKLISTVSKDLNRIQLTSEYKNVSITFNETDTKPLVVSCEIKRATLLPKFEVSKNDFIEKLLTTFNRNKIVSQNRDFNKTYTVIAGDSFKVKSIIDSPGITDLILFLDIKFIGGQAKKEEYILSLNIHRNITTLKQLESIYDLSKKLIDELIN